ncbi:hypothetical protein ACFWIJ_23095, partial [Streptomyces sp. NPDC127079]
GGRGCRRGARRRGHAASVVGDLLVTTSIIHGDLTGGWPALDGSRFHGGDIRRRRMTPWSRPPSHPSAGGSELLAAGARSPA